MLKGSPSGSGSASLAFSGITSATNTTAAMVVGTGASLAASGSGTITATAIAVGGITGLGTGVGTFLATPSSANLAAAVTGETGTGALVFGTSPTIDKPTISGTFTAGASLVNGNVCYMATADGKMELTDADAAATSAGFLAMCTATIAEDATGVFTMEGLYTTSGLAAGSTYYLSTTAGAITATAPVGTADIVRVVGYALSSTVLWFKPDATFIELA